MDEIMVSINCLVYNHEKYLRKCLDGFIMQKTNFKFEVLIHDDASTDGSVKIIKEYEKKYPDIIKPIYQKENQYSKGKKISWIYQFPRAKGKYIAFCEGDDYWCDNNKLQKQYDIMENNKDIVFCAHKVKCIYENQIETRETFPRKKMEQGIISPKEMMQKMVDHNSYPFQTSSYFLKKKCLCNIINNRPKFIEVANVGDVPLMLYYITKGNFFYIEETMSCYRVNSIGSWNLRNINAKKRIYQMEIGIVTYILFDIFTNKIYTEFVKKLIQLQEFHIYQLTNQYKNICKRKYRWIFKQESKKQQIFYVLSVFVPGFKLIYTKMKG